MSLDDPKEAMENFRQARKIIDRQIKEERRQFPYRVASNYAKFVDRFGDGLTLADLAEVRLACDFVLDRIEQLPDYISEIKHVRNCKDEMEYTCERIKEIVESRGGASTAQA